MNCFSAKKIGFYGHVRKPKVRWIETVSDPLMQKLGVVITQASPDDEEDEYGLPRLPISKKLGEPVVVLEHVFKRI